MHIHFAISGDPADIDAICTHGKENVYALCAFPYRKCMKEHKPSEFKGFIADSGAFSAMTAGLRIDDDYISDYIRWIRDEQIEHYVELDLDEVIGIDKTREMTKEIERRVGYKSIPVWHCERGRQGWLDMCDEYPYVALSLSGFTKTSKWLKSHKYQPLKWFLKVARDTDTKVHALGCTNIPLLKEYKFYSSDSSSYASGARFGTVLEFRNGRIISRRPNPEYRKDRRTIISHNINEMFRMAQYAERCM